MVIQEGPDALPLSHGRLVGANQTVGSYNKLLQPDATVPSFGLKGLSIIIDHVLLTHSRSSLSKLLAIQDHAQNLRNNFEWREREGVECFISQMCD